MYIGFLGYYLCGGLVLISVLIALVAQVRVHGAFNKYSKEYSPLDMTGAELARKMADENGLSVSISRTSGALSDHFDPTTNSVNLSSEVYDSKSVAAHAIVAHEMGHAMQHNENYIPYKIRQTTVKISNVVSRLLVPMIIIGLLVEFFLFAGLGNIILYVFVGIYAVSFAVSLVTLPVEYNASKRAKVYLASVGVEGEDAYGVSDVLNAAALTYVAAALVNLAYLLRILWILRIFSRD